MSVKNVLTAIDFGSSKVSVVIAQFDKSLKNYKVLGYSFVPSRGIRKGIIVDIEATKETLDEALKTAERMAGVPVSQVVTSISGSHIESIVSHGVVGVASQNGEIGEQDIERAYESAQAINIPQNKQILYVAPRQFIVDGQAEIKSPIGMTGVRLEVDCNVITTATTNVKNVERVLQQVDVELVGIFFGGMASALAAATDGERELGVCVLDIGSQKTDIAVYSENSLIFASSLPIGGKNISQDIAVATGLPIDIAEELKIFMSKNGLTSASRTRSLEFPDASKYLEHSATNEYTAKTLFDEVITARLEEIASLVHDLLKKQGLEKQIPAGVIITGGSSQACGLNITLQKLLKCPVRIADVSQKLNNCQPELTGAAFACVSGLFYCKNTVKHGANQDASFFSGIANFAGGAIQNRKNSKGGSAIANLKKFIHQFLP